MSTEIIKPNQVPPSFEEFKSIILNNGSIDSGILGNVADFYDKVPYYVRAMQNFDPTGIASTICQLLSENKAEREQDNIIRAIYNLTLGIQKYRNQLSVLEQTYFSQQAPSMTYRYFELSQKTFESQKIEFFRNIWLNGLLDVDRQSEEKTEIFKLAGTLTKDEILALKIFYDVQHMLELRERRPINIEQIAQALNMKIEFTQQICISLQSQGLLLDYGLGKYGYKGPVNFVMTDYAKLLVEYITEPKIN
jgi:hypothetical protein